MAKADWEAGLVWVPNAVSHNRPESPNVVRSWRTMWLEIPECALKAEAFQHLKSFTEGMGEAFGKAFAEACAQPSPNQEQEQEQEQEREKDPTPAASGVAPLALTAQGPERARSAKEAKSKPPVPGHAEVIAAFVSEYESARGCKPELDAKEHVGANRLLLSGKRSADDAIAIVRRAFADPFVREKKPSLAYIAANVNALIGRSNGAVPHDIRRAGGQPSTGLEPWMKESP